MLVPDFNSVTVKLSVWNHFDVSVFILLFSYLCFSEDEEFFIRL